MSPQTGSEQLCSQSCIANNKAMGPRLGHCCALIHALNRACLNISQTTRGSMQSGPLMQLVSYLPT